MLRAGRAGISRLQIFCKTTASCMLGGICPNAVIWKGPRYNEQFHPALCLQGHAFEAQCIVRGLNAAWTAPAHLERLHATDSNGGEMKVPSGHTLAARLWARIFHATRPRAGAAAAASGDTALSGSPATDHARALQQFLRCALPCDAVFCRCLNLARRAL